MTTNFKRRVDAMMFQESCHKIMCSLQAEYKQRRWPPDADRSPATDWTLRRLLKLRRFEFTLKMARSRFIGAREDHAIRVSKRRYRCTQRFWDWARNLLSVTDHPASMVR
jgi:hypothetical protein